MPVLPASTSRTRRSRPVRRSLRVGLGAAAALGIALTAAPAHGVATSSHGWHPTSGDHRSYTAPNGIELDYHYSAEGVDWDRPAGAVVFFDGDGTTRFDRTESRFHAQMEQAAAATNRVFIFIEAPSASRSWWAGSTDRTGQAVHDLLEDNFLPVADDSVLLAGYSGGAEFIVAGLLDDHADLLPEGSGAVMIGGGGTYGRHLDPATAATRDLQLDWVVGDDDGVGATQPASWSALAATHGAQRAFVAAGYDDADRRVIDGGHHDYDIPGIVADRLSEMDR